MAFSFRHTYLFQKNYDRRINYVTSLITYSFLIRIHQNEEKPQSTLRGGKLYPEQSCGVVQEDLEAYYSATPKDDTLLNDIPKVDKITQETATCFETIVKAVEQNGMKNEKNAYVDSHPEITGLEEYISFVCPVLSTEPLTSELSEELPVNPVQSQSTLLCQSESIALDHEQSVTGLEEEILPEGPVANTEPDTSALAEELPVNPDPSQFTLVSHEATNLASRQSVTGLEEDIPLECPLHPPQPLTKELSQELPVNSTSLVYHTEPTFDSTNFSAGKVLITNKKGPTGQKYTKKKVIQPEVHVSSVIKPEEQSVPVIKPAQEKEGEPPAKTKNVYPEQTTESQAQTAEAVPQTNPNIKIGQIARICYSRNFLLSFRIIKQKPPSLPDIPDIQLHTTKKTQLQPLDSSQQASCNVSHPTARFCRPVRAKPRFLDGLSPRRSQQEPRKIILNQNIHLRKAENAWKPAMRRTNENATSVQAQELFCKVRGILNKVTPETFQQLTNQVADLSVHTEYQLKGVIELLFEKSISEPNYSSIYANMCHCLMRLEVPTERNPKISINFRRLLLNLCQEEFEKGEDGDERIQKLQTTLETATSPTEKAQVKEELTNARNKARKRALGNITLIGELFKLKMLSKNIIHDCLTKLLNRQSEESMESFCRLLTSVGKHLERGLPLMDDHFSSIDKLIKSRKTSPRIRFMMQDVVDLRINNWVPRRENLGPKTIAQIHKEAELDRQKHAEKN
ncbi:eukaryotic translation initiation factor 4 gamma 1 isoform X1 [Pelobates cultripes]|uniref:Eukaryotic translation initiation factor 4 gamma 1 isoform X1 n=1 Tax=Pelobates cultripes TaxID=61616 RepID=A0AAD1WKY0_PELCU|nr:eukaryotic translation initiation factor 4 gamma 1 isoform X1 [Pelobates cultripes]